MNNKNLIKVAFFDGDECHLMLIDEDGEWVSDIEWTYGEWVSTEQLKADGFEIE